MQPLLQWKNNTYYTLWVCLCSLRYPACNAQAPYGHLWPDQLYTIFPHYLINGTIFGKKLLNIKCVFWFCLQHLSETFIILRRNEQDKMKSVWWYSCKAHVILVIFQWNLNFLNIFSKNTQTSNFMEIRPVETNKFHAVDRKTWQS